MAISKSTPYVRYKKDFTSSLHLGTIHIESEYLDRTQKTTIESIHGMTWHNKVVNENKELNLLSDTQLELTELEKQYWNTGEKRVSVDEIHTLEEVEPNEDGTYTYTVNSMEGEYIEIYDGINNITSISDGLDGQFEIVYDTTEEDINGNIALDSIVPQYEITDSGIGTVTGAKSTGLTLVNNITESSKEEVVAIGEYEGQYFTIEDTVQGNIKSAILKGQTLVNLNNYNVGYKDFSEVNGTEISFTNNGTNLPLINLMTPYTLKSNTKYTVIFDIIDNPLGFGVVFYHQKNATLSSVVKPITKNQIGLFKFTLDTNEKESDCLRIALSATEVADNTKIKNIVILEGDYTNINIPYFEGMQSVKMPVLKATGKNLFDGNLEYGSFDWSTGLKIENSNIIRSVNPIKINSSNICLTSATGDIRDIQYVFQYDNSMNFISYVTNVNGKISLDTNTKYIHIRTQTNGSDGYVLRELNDYQFQLEEGSTATTYESFKSNILTVNEEVELRKVGDVQDELNLSTGELTQRIGEIVLDGSENWISNKETETHASYYLLIASNMKPLFNGITNSLPSFIWEDIEELTKECFWSFTTSYGIVVSKAECPTIEDFKQKLSNNPVLFQYELNESTVKTVDLTVQNQDGGIIPRIQTQPTTTHVSTSSDGLTPVVEMSCSYDTIIKPNTTYTIKLDRPIVSDIMYLQVDLGGTMMMLDADVNAFTIKTPSTLSHSQLRLSGTGNTVKEIIVLEGNRVNDKIEYFEGMKNVENPILIVSNCPYVFGKGGRL